MKRLAPIFALALILGFASRLHAQMITAQQVNTQQLTLESQNPVAAPTGVTVTPNIAGSSTYFYWIVTHSGAEVSAPAGPFVAANAPATLGGIYHNSIVWTPNVSSATYDLLRTATSAVPTGSCGCAVGTALTNTSFTDGLSSTTSYTVGTSADQVSLICTNIIGCGGNGGTSTGNEFEVKLAQTCSLNSPSCFVVHDDGRIDCDASIGNASPNVTIGVSDSAFSQADVGKIAWMTNLQCGVVTQGGSYVVTQTTIQSVQSATQATLGISATQTCASNCTLTYGTDDAANWAAAWSYLLSVCPSSGSVFELPTGVTLLSKGQFNSSGNCGAEAFSNFLGGIAVEGHDYATTILQVIPNFDYTSCTGPVGQGTECFGGITPENRWHDFTINGPGNQTLPSSANGKIGLGINGGFPARIHVYNWGGSQTGSTPGATFTGIQFGPSTGSQGGIPAFNIISQASGGLGVIVQSGVPVLCQACQFSQNETANVYLIQASSLPTYLWLTDGSVIGGNEATSTCDVYMHGGSAGTNVVFRWTTWADKGIPLCENNSGTDSVLLQHSSGSQQGPETLLSNFGTAAIRVNVQNTTNSGGQYIFSNASTGSIAVTDQGGSSLSATTSIFHGSNTSLFQSNSITGTSLIATNVTPSTGWGTSGAAGNGVSSPSGDSRNMQFTITAGGTPTLNPTIAIAFPTAFWAAPICSASQTGGTGVISDLSLGTPTTSGVTLTWQGTPVAASTYVLALRCQ